MLLSSASRGCARLLAEAEKLKRQAPVNLAQPDADLKRGAVLRLVDVDLLQNCNGLSNIAQADNLLKHVVRHGGLFVRRAKAADQEGRQGRGAQGARGRGAALSDGALLRDMVHAVPLARMI